MNPRPGEVWLADLGLAAKSRPVIVVSRHDSDPLRSLVLYVPLTTQNRKSRYEVVLPQLGFLHHNSVANVQGLGSLPYVRLERKLGILPITVMKQLKKALSFVLELSDKGHEGRPESAGINRHRVGDERALHERSS